jgi:hypothetical protein
MQAVQGTPMKLLQGRHTSRIRASSTLSNGPDLEASGFLPALAHTHAPRTHTFTSPSDQGPSEKPGNGEADCDYLALLLLVATVSESRSPES